MALFALSLGLGLSLAAQQGSGPVLHTAPAAESSAATLHVDAKLVNIPVVVHDKHGSLVQDLTKDSFNLWVDNKPATIRYFNQDTNLPLTLGLLVDVSMSQRDALDEERKASAAFLDDMLSTSDKAFVIQFARQADLLQDLTNSKPKLQEGLQQLATPSPNDAHSDNSGDQNGGNNGNGSGNNGNGGDNSGNNGGYGRNGRGGGSNGGYTRAGTVLYDALFLSSDDVIGKQTGRKALIILTDGVDHGSKESLPSAIEAAQRADTIVYAIYFKGHDQGSGYQNNRGHGGGFPGGRGGGFPGGYPGGGGGGYPGGGGRGGGNRQPESEADGKKILQRIADETGGRLFEMDKKDSLAGIYKQIGDELRAQYRLGYTPDKDAASDGYHRIQVSLKGDPKDRFVQTRDGYYTGAAN
jgi:VWFA-related protein